MNKSKTNALRMLERAGLPYRTVEYEVDETDLSGVHVAQQLGQPCGQVFKTLVLKGVRRGYLVCCIPVAEELDLKKAAVAAGEKKVEMLPLKELLPVTGYIRGGCSPVGMKKQFPTWLDETALLFEEIAVSAGVRGLQMLVRPTELIRFLSAQTADLTIGKERS